MRVGFCRLMAGAGLLAALAVQAQGEANCGSLATTTGGPWDYRVERGANLDLVERHHFTRPVQQLLSGQTTTRENLAADIAYTLRAFPNHHRALDAMTRLARERKTAQPPGSEHTLDCWYERALRFRKDDTVVRAMYALYLGQSGRRDLALTHLEQALQFAADNAISIYNIGLALFEVQAFDRAVYAAHRAAELGNPRTGLADKLKKGGHWREPVPSQAASAASS
ncbi:MAG: ABC transporter permease [Aquabacterium sp.]|nr:ABC transporter permease [Aquabacterium sp.]